MRAPLLLPFVFLAAPALAGERPALLCGGAAPAWALEIGPEEAVFTAPDRPQIDYSIPHEKPAEGRDWPRVLTLLAPEDTALAVLRPGACRVSGRTLEWTLDLLTQRAGEAIVLTGCCRLRPGE